MAKISIVKGTTSKLLDLFVQDSSSTVGAGLTGLAYNTGSLTGYYYREGAASAVAITLATMTLGTWATGGFIVADGTNMPGVYQLGIPDAALASGANSVVVMLKGAANMAPVILEIELTAVNNQSATAFVTSVALAASQIAVKKNTALANFQFLLVSSTDHVTPTAGLTVTATRSIDGGAFGAASNSAASLSSGIYTINLSAGDLNGTVITFLFTATGADARYVTILTQA